MKDVSEQKYATKQPSLPRVSVPLLLVENQPEAFTCNVKNLSPVNIILLDMIDDSHSDVDVPSSQ